MSYARGSNPPHSHAPKGMVEEIGKRWSSAFKDAFEHDAWGQVEEAIQAYQELEAAVSEEHDENYLDLPLNRLDNVGKLCVALRARIAQLQSSEKVGGGLDDIRLIKDFMQSILIDDVEFPVVGVKSLSRRYSEPNSEKNGLQDLGDSLHTEDSSLLPPPKGVGWGDTTLTILVEKWGFKDPSQFHRPQAILSVVDGNGCLVEASQGTGFADGVQDSHLIFDQKVHVQTPFNRFEKGHAIFFELQYYKPKKKRKSVKAYCLMELDEINPGRLVLESYKKPTDLKRKKTPRLLTVKPLYLHLTVIITKH